MIFGLSPPEKAILGFNLNTDEYTRTTEKVITPFFNIILPETAKATFKKTIVSDVYMEMHAITRLEIEVKKSGTYSTCIVLN